MCACWRSSTGYLIERPPAERLGRRPDRAARPHRRRHRPADPAHRPCAHLVLHREPRRLGADPGHWQARTQAIEDRLSEALHAALTQRFVDRRRAALHRRLKSGSEVIAAVNAADEVIVEGHVVGTLGGLRFAPVSDVDAEEAKPLLAAARRALGPALRGPRRTADRRRRRTVQADRDRRHPVAPRDRGQPPARRRAAASAPGAEGRRPARWRIPPHDRPAPARLDRCQPCSAACARCSP